VEEAEKMYAELQDDFIRRSHFFTLKTDTTEIPSVYLRRVIETTRRASLKKMDLDDWAVHQFMATITAKLREYIILHGRDNQPKMEAVKAALKQEEYMGGDKRQSKTENQQTQHTSERKVTKKSEK
jgi:preprotein translocase subunit SecA